MCSGQAAGEMGGFAAARARARWNGTRLDRAAWRTASLITRSGRLLQRLSSSAASSEGARTITQLCTGATPTHIPTCPLH